jgi:RNA polymerase sigma factor (sigma-70 family)
MAWFGPKQSIQQLVQDHYEALYRFAYRLCGSGPEAEDLTQETFCQAHRRLAQLRDAARAKAWLFSILRNAYLHKLRSTKRMQALSPEALADIPERLPDPLPEIEPAQLQKALNELPEDFRAPLLLFYFEDFSYRDIALELGVPLGTVMSRLARAKAHLRGRLLQPAAGPAAAVLVEREGA